MLCRAINSKKTKGLDIFLEQNNEYIVSFGKFGMNNYV